MNISSFFFIAALLCVLGTVAVLGLGIFSMSKGGDFNKKYSQRLMQARVGFQGMALLMLVLAFATS